MKYEDKKYRPYCFKLHKTTYKLLKEKKEKSGKSWNLFIYNLIRKEGDKNGN